MIGFLRNIFLQKCPRCREGELFVSGTYNLKSFTKMNEKCDCCGLKYEMEPSFFYGALYVSYALQVALFITIFVAITVLAPDAPASWYIIGVVFSIIVFFPLVMRLSRSIWIHFFVKYEPGHKKKVKHEHASQT
ncbi:MAG: DUF983 domain-containing protein [Flammeovirgaceae bacterium]|nr:DUF983 domain-containing protein [Flammeovirgaceae bacterium]MBR07119.1 DUF983 domain-containing protein [Rickettsiales bacterium]HCX24824.1 DUF983 domain-containing protein [Cytophagales bacterium]|tara:strand:- start:359 stop:760 length:402 start_codon:yes stop_codon:yes gene_type:complete